MSKSKINILILLCCLALAGCETVEGMGQDFENTGENLKEVADKINDAAPKPGDVTGTMMPDAPKP